MPDRDEDRFDGPRGDSRFIQLFSTLDAAKARAEEQARVEWNETQEQNEIEEEDRVGVVLGSWTETGGLWSLSIHPNDPELLYFAFVHDVIPDA